MLLKFFTFLLLVNFGVAQFSTLSCDLQHIGNTCRCTITIYNPDGNDNFIIRGNPAPNCTLEDVDNVVITGLTTNVPTVICRELPKLQRLVMTNVGVNSIYENPFRYCNNLKELRLNRNKISNITSYTFSNTILELLDLNNNLLKNVDSWAFYGLESLKSLFLYNNPDIDLPSDVFKSLQSLEYLSLFSCRITEIKSGWFDELTNLTSLLMYSNMITTVPSLAFQQLTKLQDLDLDYNQIASIPEITFQRNLDLVQLHLSYNKLTSLPSKLFENQHKLEYLYLNNNQFTQLPSNIFTSLISLQYLIMSNCNISEIKPQWFATMKLLWYIDISKNNISEIPEDTFTATDNLRRAVFNNNKISKLDSRSFGSLMNLEEFRIQNNKVNEIDHHFMNQSNVCRGAYFSNNNCVNFDTNNFIDQKVAYMEQMKECFDNFDRNVIHLESFNSTVFDWHNIRPNDGWTTIKVTVKASESVQIGLTDMLERANPLIEIRIGENEDRKSQIWEQNKKVFADKVPYRLSETEERKFIIGWNFGIVLVYRDEDRLPFMAHFIKKSFSVNFFGLRTLINPGISKTKANWKVLRIQGNVPVAMKNVYDDIQKKMKLKMPIELEKYLLRV